VAQIFYVHCPSCGGKFPVHSELWQVAYDLLCPFCQNSFSQEQSPLIITASGERRPGTNALSAGTAKPTDGPGTPDAPRRAGPPPPSDTDPTATAESM
jgi:hypothetical protein